MQLNVLNDLAKAKRRWTEKKICPFPLLSSSLSPFGVLLTFSVVV